MFQGTRSRRPPLLHQITDLQLSLDVSSLELVTFDGRVLRPQDHHAGNSILRTNEALQPSFSTLQFLLSSLPRFSKCITDLKNESCPTLKFSRRSTIYINNINKQETKAFRDKVMISLRQQHMFRQFVKHVSVSYQLQTNQILFNMPTNKTSYTIFNIKFYVILQTYFKNVVLQMCINADCLTETDK